MISEAFDDSVRYALASREYLGNALGFLQRGEAGKASEFLWGSVAEMVKAVGAGRGRPAHTHASIRRLAAKLAEETHSPIISQGLGVAEHLHSNFHEVELDIQDVGVHVQTITDTVTYLYSLVLPEVRDEVEKREMQHARQETRNGPVDTPPEANQL